MAAVKSKQPAKPAKPAKAKKAKAGYRERIEAMIAELDANPRVQVTWAYVAPPASASTIAKVEKAYGPLHPSIKAFYQSCDGFALQWYDKASPNFDAQKHKRKQGKPSSRDIGGDYNYASGSAGFSTLQDTFVSASWKEILYFDWMESSATHEFAKKSYPLLDFSKSIRVVDNFSMYNLAGLITIVDKSNPPVSFGDDHGAYWNDSRLMSFADYLELVIATYASVEARRDLLGGRSKKAVPDLTLDKVLDKWQSDDD